MGKEFIRKIITVVASFAILLQSFTPLVALAPQVAYAQEVSPTDTPAPTNTITPTTDQTSTTPSDTVTPTDTVSPTPDLSVTTTPSDTPTLTDTPTSSPTDAVTPTTDQTSPTASQDNQNNPSNGPPSVNLTGTSAPTPSVTPEDSSNVSGHVDTTILSHISAPSLDLSSPDDQSATLSTDKADYAPTDTAVITGANFAANKIYTLEIVSTDTPTVDFTTVVTTDNSGDFVYAYQLDGNYRPNYTVYVKDGPTTVATTTFTDSDSGFLSPSSNTGLFTSPNNAYSLDGSVATSTNSQTNQYYNYGFSIPSGSTINGIEVDVHANKQNGGSGTNSYTVALSYDGGTSWTAGQTTSALTTTIANYALGSSAFTWGHTWSDTEINTNFRVKVTSSNGTGKDNYLDWISVKVTYTSTVTPTPTPTSAATPTPTPAGSFGSVTDSNVACMADQPGQDGLVCTANDTSLSNATIISINDDGCKFPGDTVNFTASWQIGTNATQRYNMGLWFATAGQSSAMHGTCSVSTLPSSPSPFFSSKSGDTCGDMSSSGTGTVTLTMTAVCNPDVNGLLKLPYCTSWQQNDNNTCTDPQQTVPGTGSKCSCQDGSTIPVTIPPAIEVIKSLSPSNDPGLFNLQVNGITASSSANVGDGGDTGKVGVSAGSNTFGETAGTNTSLSDYTASASCVLRGTQTAVAATQSGNTWTLSNVTNGQDIVCTITNTRSTGTIELKKVWSGAGGQTTLTIGTTAGGSDVASVQTGTNGTAPLTTGTKTVTSGQTYYVSESSGLSNYSSALACTDNGNSVTPGVDNSVTVGAGHTVICTFTNTLQQAHLTLVKSIINDNGGTASASAWTLTATGNTNISGTTGSTNVTNAPVLPGTYTLAESGGPSGYTASTYSCVKNGGQAVNGNSITLANGDSAACTITNDDNKPSLTLTKHVSNTHGGTAVAGDFTLTATGPTTISGAGTATSGATFSAGTYTLSESSLTGYQAGSWSCTGDVTNTGNSITLGLGQSASCDITNSDVAPQLTVIKHVINDNGGSATASAFTMDVNGTHVSSSLFGGSETGTTVTLDAGSYSVGEISAISGYTASFSADCQGTIAVGESKTCTITNDDQPATLIVIKHVINDNGGKKVAGDFTVDVAGNSASPSSFPGDENGTSVTLNAGSYSVDEGAHDGYDKSLSTDCSGTIANGETKTCTITNDDIAPQLTLVKAVHNDNGGKNLAGDWTLTATGPATLSGTTGVTSDSSFKAGTYTLAESNDPSGYSASDWSCTNGVTVTNSQITLGLGDSTTCTITNSDIAPTLKLVKNVTNDNGGTAVAGDWNLTATGTNGFSDKGDSTTFHTVLANETYTLSEANGPSDYTAGSWSCDGGSLIGDQLTLGLNENVTCTITNNDNAPSLTLVKFVDGGTASAAAFTLTATGPTTISGAGGVVSGASFSAGTYTLSETNLAGYTASSWGCVGGTQNGNQITLGLGDSAVCTITNTRDTGSITVHKQVDTAGTGDFSGDDTTAATLGFTWSLDGSGTTAFGALVSGVTTLDTHEIQEDLNNKPYHFVGWYDNSGRGSCTNPDGTTLPVDFSLANNGDTKTITLCNARDTGTIHLEKVLLDPNGNVITTDPTKFTFTASQNQTSVDAAQLAGGESHDFVVPTGNYDVTETPIDGYKFLGCEAEVGTAITNGENVDVSVDEDAYISCTNQQELPILTITKTNDKLGTDVNPGSSVMYTLTITATQSAAQNVVLTDLLPKGFVYRDGSATIDTGSGAETFTNFSDDYHSPGIWNIGSISKNQTITLTLIADISGDQNPGNYKDVAYAEGQSLAGNTVSATSQPTSNTTDNGVVDDNFVGTQVTVVKDQQDNPSINVINTQDVLGAATSALPDTGANTLWVVLGGLITLSGLITISFGIIVKKKYV